MRKAKTKKKARRAWSKDEVKLLKKLYQDGGAGEIAERIGRPLTAVQQKAYSMGIKTRDNRLLWSANEIRLLQRLYRDENAQSIADKLGRTVGAVTAKAYRMGLTEGPRVWSKGELDLLKRLYPSKTAEQTAEQIGRSLPAIQGRIHKLGLRKSFRYDERHRVVKGSKEKLCLKCRKWKAESQFYRNRRSKDGLAAWCRKCLSTVREKRRLAVKN